MTRVNLRAEFAKGLASSLSAQQVFSDRVEEVEAFVESVRWLSDPPADNEVSPVIDRSKGRKNVLCYYGMGGIGKSTLSMELERRIRDWDLPLPEIPRASSRIDFGEASSVDLETYVLRLRAGMASLGAHWMAFDLAFAVYWERAHPGEPIQEFIHRDAVLNRLASQVHLVDQITTTIASIATAGLPVAGVAHRVGGLVYHSIKSAMSKRQLLRDCPLFEDLIEADGTHETLSYLPYLLAWDLDKLKRRRLFVVFLDTWESFGGRSTREFERLVQRSIYLMPNALFVITGRDRLDWGDVGPEAELDFAGAAKWPHLNQGHVKEDPRQHLVGFLSDGDADNYLCRSLLDSGVPAIPAPIRAQIVAGSGGLPLYLDLSVTHYLEVTGRREQPAVTDFGGTLPAVIARIMRDLDREERDLLRGCCLLNAFDSTLAKAVAPSTSDATIRRFLCRAFLQADHDRVWPYSIHNQLRGEVVAGDSQLRDGWSAVEWADARARILRSLGESSRASMEQSDRSLTLACFIEAQRIAATGKSLPDWIVEVASYLVRLGLWSALDGGTPAVEEITEVDAFNLGLDGIKLRRDGNLAESVDRLTRAISSGQLPNRASEFFEMHRAHSVRNLGRYTEAAQRYGAIAQRDGQHHDEAMYWLSDYDYLLGKFDKATGVLDGLGDGDPFLKGEILRLRGHILRVNALFDGAEVVYREALSLARDVGSLSAEGKALTNIAETLAWLAPRKAEQFILEATEVNQAVANNIEIVKLHAVSALTVTGPRALEQARQHTSDAIDLAEKFNNRGGYVFALVPEVFQACVGSDLVAARDALSRLEAVLSKLDGYQFWLQVGSAWIEPLSVRAAAGGVKWIGGRRAAMVRWRQVLEYRRDA